MTAVPLPDDLGRFGFATEATFKGSVGSITVPKTLMALDPKPARARLARAVQRNSTKDQPVDKMGNQAYDLALEVLASDQSAPDIGDFLKTSLGEEVAASALVYVSGTQSDVTISSGTFDDILQITGSDGLTYYRPVKSVAGNVATFAIKLPLGVTAAGVKNASQTTPTAGRAFRDKPFGVVDTYQLLSDQAGATGEVPIKAQGAVPLPFKLVWTLEQLLKWSFSFKAAVWSTLSAGASGLSDTTDTSVGYLSDVISLGIQDLTTPVVLTELGPKSMDIPLGYTMDPGTAGQGISGTAVPGSNITRWIRGNSAGQVATVTLDDGDWKTWDAAVQAGTAYQLWADFQPGVPSGTVATTRICLWLPRVIPVQAMPVKVNGQVCTQLTLFIDRSSSPSLKRAYLSVFGG